MARASRKSLAGDIFVPCEFAAVSIVLLVLQNDRLISPGAGLLHLHRCFVLSGERTHFASCYLLALGKNLSAISIPIYQLHTPLFSLLYSGIPQCSLVEGLAHLVIHLHPDIIDLSIYHFPAGLVVHRLEAHPAGVLCGIELSIHRRCRGIHSPIDRFFGSPAFELARTI